MKEFKFIALLFLFVSPTLLFAENLPDCKFPAYLTKGFDLNRYKQCDRLTKQCPGDGILHERKCVDGVVKRNTSCDQFAKLVADLNIPANQVTAASLAEFTVITITFPADGQFSYYLISPNGCLLNTKLDPRTLDSNLNAKYQNTSFMITHWGEPQYQSNPDGTPSITTILRVTESCIACPLIGYAKIKFDFDKHGNLVRKSLVSFNQDAAKK